MFDGVLKARKSVFATIVVAYLSWRNINAAIEDLSKSSSSSDSGIHPQNSSLSSSNIISNAKLRDSLCSLESYHNYYETMFSNHTIPFTKTCLRSLIDSNLEDMTLRVGLVRRFYEELQASIPARHIVWYCRAWCGGLGDRILQIMQTFYMAIAMNATFTIDMEYPVHWEDFFQGLNSDYETTSAKGGFFDRFHFAEPYRASRSFALLPELTNHSLIFFNSNVNAQWAGVLKGNQTHWFKNQDLEWELFRKHEERGNEIVVLPKSPRYFLNPYLENPFAQGFIASHRLRLQTTNLYFIFYQLFMARPSLHLHEAVTSAIQQLTNHFVVGMQIRLGGNRPRGKAANHWYDPILNAPSCTKCFIAQARNVCQTMGMGRKCAVFVSSDKESVVAQVVAAFAKNPNISVVTAARSGKVTHIGQGKFKDPVKENTRTFCDWYILAAYSDVFLLSGSSYGGTASIYKMANYTHRKPRFLYVTNKPSCNFTPY